MKSSVKSRYKVISLILCFFIAISGLLVLVGNVHSNQVSAANTITFYFDASCTGKQGSTYGWSTNMTNVYYYAYKSSGNTGIQPMTLVQDETGSGGGNLFKATIDKSAYSYIILLNRSTWGSKPQQTVDFALSNVNNNSILMLNEYGFNVDNSFVQGMYVSGTHEDAPDYSSQKFSILNMDDQDVTLNIRYSTRTKKYENGTYGDWNSESGVEYSDYTSVTIPARHYLYQYFSVPQKANGGAWQSVHICTSNNVEIKKYYFPEGKILGRSFFYGVTDFQSNTSIIDYGDRTKLCYQTSDLGSLGSTNYEIYFDKGFFISAPEYGKISNPSASYSTATALVKDGNAKYVTNGAVNLTQWTRPTGTDMDLSARIMSVQYGGIQYNIFAPKNSGDNLVTVNDNVAVISGKYTVQSTNQYLNGQKYITVAADFFDYQYDHNSANDSNFTYKEYYQISKSVGDGNTESKYFSYSDSIIFTNSLGWSNVYAYFFDGYSGDTFPGHQMKFIGQNNDSQDQYIIKVPDGARKVIFSNGSGTQTVDTTIVANKGYYAINETDGGKYKTGTWSLSGSSSNKANSKRPYLVVNEALSKSDYGSTTLPMYLGQFWLPFNYTEAGFSNTSAAYNDTTANYQRAANNSVYQNNHRYFIAGEQDEGTYTHFGFGDKLNNFKWGANLAFRTNNQESGTHRPFDAVAQGLVGDYLEGSNATTFVRDGKLLAPSSTKAVPYFDSSWWNGSFTTSQGNTVQLSDYLTEYEDLDFPFFEIPASAVSFQNGIQEGTGKLLSDTSDTYRGNYYVFDSQKYSVKVDAANNKLEKHNELYKLNDPQYMVYDNYGDKGSNTTGTDGQRYGMFPFNSPNEGGYSSDKLHYGFGIRYDIDFYLTKAGTVDGNADGTAITFTFQGDDDVWVFLDGKLMLDMGGAHKNAAGEINFRTKKTWISAIGQANTNNILSDNTSSNNTDDNVLRKRTSVTTDFGTSDWASRLTEGKHTITMFYMERGMLNSNLYCMFNLPFDLTKYELQNDTDFSGVNTGFTTATKIVAENDVFNYQIQNKGTDAGKVLDSGYKYPSNTAVTRANHDISTVPTTTLSTSGSETQVSNKFKGSPGGYQPMMSSTSNVGVTYQLTEPSFTGAGITTFNTRKLGGSGSEANTEGIVSMQYGEMATFSKQLEGGSAMIVKQLNTLSTPNNNSRVSGYNSAGRKSSVYYVTHYKQDTQAASSKYRKYAGIYRGDDVASLSLSHATMYGDSPVPKNYSTNHVINPQVENGALEFVFADPEDAGNGYVYLRQVVVNEIRTVKLTIRKDILAGETCNDMFNFKIKFSTIFGSNAGDNNIDYNQIAYKKYNISDPNTVIQSTNLVDDGGNDDGSFSLTAGQYIEIDNIPVMTSYYITESTTSSTYELSDEYSVNMGKSDQVVVLNSNKTTVVTNKRKTGTLQVQKLVYDESGNQMNTTGGLTTEFTLMIGLKPQGNVDLDNYPIKFTQNSTDLIATGKAVKLTSTQLAPYLSEYPDGENWSVYNVNVIANTAANGTLRLNIENLPVGTVYKVHEWSESLPAGYSIPTEKPSDSVWDNASYRDQMDHIDYSNVIYLDDDTKTVDKLATDANFNDLVTVENKLNPIHMPSTGGTPFILLFPFGIIAIVISAGALVIYKRRLQYKTVIK